jgi:GT2 family glycosyltransferase
MRMRLENHKIFLRGTDFPHGVSKARQAIVDWALEDDYEYFLRVDDDVILEPDYLEQLFEVLNEGYDIASGVTVPMTGPILKRETKNVGSVINKVILDENGNYIFNGDDCGCEYLDKKIMPAHHFRSCALMKRSVMEKIKYVPTPLSTHGFREEQIFSYKAQIDGLKIGVNTKAVNYHQMTPSGGERFPNQVDLTKFNQEQFEKWTIENKDKLLKIFPFEELTKQELMKETNLCRLR